MGASILPITLHQGHIYLLFGREKPTDQNPGWSDFGGGTDPGESFLDTACREGMEESVGFLGSARHIRTHLRKYGTYLVEHKSSRGTYRCHLFPITYDEMLPIYYNNSHKVIEQHLSQQVLTKHKIFEKVEIRWVNLNEIAQFRPKFRTFYRKVIDLLLQDITNIREFVKHNRLFKQSDLWFKQSDL